MDTKFINLTIQAERGNAKAQYELGCSYLSELQLNYKAALYWLLKSAEQGEEQAIEILKEFSKDAKIRKEEAIKVQEFELALLYRRLEIEYIDKRTL